MTELYQRIPQIKRERIMQASIEEFAANGYDHANTNRVAKMAGISVGSLFQYFESKEDLFISTVEYGAAQMKQQLSGVVIDDGDIYTKIEKVLRTVQKHSRENVGLIRLYGELAAHGRSKMALKEVDWLESFTAQLYAQIIERAKEKGEVRPDCDAKMFAFLLDDLFMMLQFSYTCDYYRERFKIYVSGDILNRDDFVVEQTMKFIRSAFQK